MKLSEEEVNGEVEQQLKQIGSDNLLKIFSLTKEVKIIQMQAQPFKEIDLDETNPEN